MICKRGYPEVGGWYGSEWRFGDGSTEEELAGRIETDYGATAPLPWGFER